MKFGTKLIHGRYLTDPGTGALSVPIYQVSTYHQDDVEKRQPYDYSRSGNPTRSALEEAIAALESGKRGFAFSSGMAATSSVLSIFSSGDHFVVRRDVYGGTYRVLTTLFNRLGIETTFVDTTKLENIAGAVRKNTRAVFLETPSNPLLKITDLKGAIALAKDNGALVIIDNTFMTPYLQRPLELGADIVIHSATKFIGGHSDVVGGLAAVKDEEIAERIYSVQNGFGAVLGPQDCWLLLRGLKTLKVRMDCQQKNALKISQWLATLPQIKEVFYPGLLNHPGHQLHVSQAEGPGAVLSFRTEDAPTAKSFMKKLSFAAVAVSLGGVETIVSYPAKMSHASIPKPEREKLGITDNLIRVSPGLEDVDDLISDFEKALNSSK